LDPSLFRAFRDLAFEQAGIRLGETKVALVSARVGKRVRALGLRGEREYLEALRKDETGQELIHFLDVISTNFTSFFREPDHFDRIRALVEERLRRGQRCFRFWSAAASSGEEPYSLAIELAETFGDLPVDWRMLATDLSTRVLQRAREGVYSERQLEPLSRARKIHWLTPAGSGPDGKLFAIRPELKAHIAFARLNLAQPPFPMHGPFDVVLCRNVMIYLDVQVRQDLISEIERLLAPEGLLAIGHAETLTSLRSGLKMVVPSVFRKPRA
jgi:chemotaxis protein methyltransferase CheR